MMNLYGGTGMGSAGTGVNTGGSGMGLQQLMAMLSAGQGGGAAMGPNTATPMAPGGASTPMSNYIGAPQGMAGGMQHPAMPPVAGNPAPAMPGQAAGGGQDPMKMMQMLAMLKQGQGGLSPQGTPAGGAPIPGMPNTGGAGSMIPAWLQAMLHSGSYGATGMGMAPSGTGIQGGGV